MGYIGSLWSIVSNLNHSKIHTDSIKSKQIPGLHTQKLALHWPSEMHLHRQNEGERGGLHFLPAEGL